MCHFDRGLSVIDLGVGGRLRGWMLWAPPCCVADGLLACVRALICTGCCRLCILTRQILRVIFIVRVLL